MKTKKRLLKNKYDDVFKLALLETLVHTTSLIFVLSNYSVFELRSINISNLLVLYLVVTIIFALIKQLPQIRPYLIKNFEKSVNPLRWMEYSISSTIMVYVIAIIFGISSKQHLLSIIISSIVMISTGYLIEKSKGTLQSIYNYLGFGLFFWIWGSIGYKLFLDNEHYFSGGEGFLVQTVYSLLMVLFLCFGVNSVFATLKLGEWKDYIFVEKTYTALSIISKSLLVWILWAGIYFLNIA
jgi:Heliorhodopsin